MKKLLVILTIVLMTSTVWAGRALETVLSTDYGIVIDTSKTGVIGLNETTTPAAVSGDGAFYFKNDDEAYAQDGAGIEERIKRGSSDYGEMGNVYGSSATELMRATDEWHAAFHTNITGSSPHLNNNFTFTAGLENTIASIADNSGTAAGTVLVTTGTAHGLTVGDYITQNDCTDGNYVGVFTVLTVPLTTTYTITATWGATGTGYVQMGSYLTVASSGIYRGVWSMAISQSAANSQTTIITPFVNTNQSTKAVAVRLVDNSSDIGSIGGNGLMSFSAGDRVWFAVQSTSAQTLTFLIFNVTIH